MDKKAVLQESELVPYHLAAPPGERVMVLAPHPDDETLGCGGTVRLLVEAGKAVRVLFLTSGGKGDPSPEASARPGGEAGYSLMREREAEKALRVLGVSGYEFLRYPDRGMYEHYQDALERILGRVNDFAPDTIYAPSMVELNPDHRAAADLSMEIQKRYLPHPAGSGDRAVPLTLVFYEVTTPLRPNVLVDITPVHRRKKRAVKRYRSQLKVMDYLAHIDALNTIRAVTLNGPRYVEAFWAVERPLADEDIVRWLSYRETLGGRG
jgi:LmbE family N-acetylglucosaminyl deacetylase